MFLLHQVGSIEKVTTPTNDASKTTTTSTSSTKAAAAAAAADDHQSRRFRVCFCRSLTRACRPTNTTAAAAAVAKHKQEITHTNSRAITQALVQATTTTAPLPALRVTSRAVLQPPVDVTSP